MDNSADSIESSLLHAPSKVAAAAGRRQMDTSASSATAARGPNSGFNSSYVSDGGARFENASDNCPNVLCSQSGGYRRCRALYDCNADNDDELEFKEGEVLVVLNERTDDENWMEGEIEGDAGRRGMFPVSFVHMLPD